MGLLSVDLDPRPVAVRDWLAMRVAAARVRRAGGASRDGMGLRGGGVHPDRDVRADSEIHSEFSFQTPNLKSPPKEASLWERLSKQGSKN